MSPAPFVPGRDPTRLAFPCIADPQEDAAHLRERHLRRPGSVVSRPAEIIAHSLGWDAPGSLLVWRRCQYWLMAASSRHSSGRTLEQVRVRVQNRKRRAGCAGAGPMRLGGGHGGGDDLRQLRPGHPRTCGATVCQHSVLLEANAPTEL